MLLNKVLTDRDRKFLAPQIEEMWKLCPSTMSRKIQRANVQQAFVYNLVKKLVYSNVIMGIISIGCYDDTAYESLKNSGYGVIGIDPEFDYDLHTYVIKFNNKFDIAFSTSVIEHVENDLQFLEDMCLLLNPGGYGILTMDFNNDYKPGYKLPKTDKRFYTRHDLEVTFSHLIRTHNCSLVGEYDWTEKDSFINEGCNYSFSTFVFRKNIDV